MSRIHFLTGLLALGLAVGCKAQPAAEAAQNLAMNRRIEVMVRSQYNVPPDVDVVLGARTPSQLSGYDALPVTLSQGSKKTVVDFLISTDGKTLARLDKFDLANDPLFSIDVAGRPIRGNLECGYCAQMHHTLFPATLDRYKDQVRFIYKDYPLPPEMHPWAMHAAVNANCLAAQSGEVYWNYVDYLHSHGQEVNGDNGSLAKSFDALNRIARQEAELGKLDSVKLDACLAAQDETRVRASMKEGEALGVEGTPAIFVEGERIGGALPQSQVWTVIDRALRAAGEQPPAAPLQPAGTAR